MNDCIFCAIGRGEVPARVVWEDERVVAFDDIAPQAPVHTLVIPREHHAHLGDKMPDDLIASLFSDIPRIVEVKGLSESCYRLIVNKGSDANQTVAHVHVHVLGGRPMSHGMVRFAEDAT